MAGHGHKGFKNNILSASTSLSLDNLEKRFIADKTPKYSISVAVGATSCVFRLFLFIYRCIYLKTDTILKLPLAMNYVLSVIVNPSTDIN